MFVTLATEQLSAVVGVPKLIPVAVQPTFVVTFIASGAVIVGLILSMFTVNVPVLVAEPAGVVTPIVPVVPAPTLAFIRVEDITSKLSALVPPNVTAVAPVKLVPVIFISASALFAQPLVGVKLAIVG